ncbi:HAMP domain-containing histidine kinase [Blautia schinkii]|nr:HAMP domain-containing histidine kinase [Blautia schinkii]
MMNSLRKKYIFAGCVLITGFLAALLIISMILKDGLLEHWNKQRMESLAVQLVEDLADKAWDFSREDLDSLAFENNLSITIVDEDFKIIATTSNREAAQQKLGERSMFVVRNHMREIQEEGSSFSSNFDDNNKALFVQVNKLGGHGYLIIKRSVNGINSSIQIMEVSYTLAAFLTLLLGIPVIIYLSGKMARPILEINKVTKQISHLNFSETVSVNTKDEMGTLAESVNLMSDKLEEAMNNLKKDVELRKTLVRNMAHELKTPTAVIMGYAENMPYISRKQPDKLEKYCEVISAECERMDSMIQQMLEASSYEFGEEVLQKTNFHVQMLLEGIYKYFLNDFPERKDTFEIINEVNDKICADYEVLQRALYNYVKNAVRYGYENGKIVIRAWEDSGFIWFSIFNEGEQIPVEEQDKIWNVFYKVNQARTREQHSFGIGLSIVKQAAEAHGGGVSVQNKENGVEFGLYIKKYK